MLWGVCAETQADGVVARRKFSGRRRPDTREDDGARRRRALRRVELELRARTMRAPPAEVAALPRGAREQDYAARTAALMRDRGTDPPPPRPRGVHPPPPPRDAPRPLCLSRRVWERALRDEFREQLPGTAFGAIDGDGEFATRAFDRTARTGVEGRGASAALSHSSSPSPPPRAAFFLAVPRATGPFPPFASARPRTAPAARRAPATLRPAKPMAADDARADAYRALAERASADPFACDLVRWRVDGSARARAR